MTEGSPFSRPEESVQKFTAFTEKAEAAETALLSVLYIDLLTVGSACVQAGITEAHFVTSERKGIYMALMMLWKEGKSADASEIIQRIRETGQKVELQALMSVFESEGTVQGYDWHIQRLMQCHCARALYTLGAVLRSKAYNVTEDMEELLSAALRDMAAISLTPETEKTSFREHLQAVIASLQDISSPKHHIDFGLGLDETAGPFCRSDLIVIAAETGKGKSAIAGNIVEHVASKGFRCAVFSLEMSGMQVAERMLASQSRVDMRAFRLHLRRMGDQLNYGSGNTFNTLDRTIASIRDWPIDIIERSTSLPLIAAHCRRLKSAKGLDLVVVDYAQFVEGIRERGDNREREVASISRGLKMIAIQMDCIVILLSQLNDDGRLRESRALGQDANCVLLLEQAERSSTIRVCKARSAPSGGDAEISLTWTPTLTRFDAAK